MKKRYKVAAGLAFAGCLLILLLILARISGAYQFYSIPTPSNEETIPQGSYVFASNLMHPKRMDFICHLVDESKAYPNGDMPEQDKGKLVTWVHRLCGMPGDTITISEGVLFVNGKNMDTPLRLKHMYTVAAGESDRLIQKYHVKEGDVYGGQADGQVFLFLNQFDAKNEGLKRVIIPKDQTDSAIVSVFHHPWNRDHFGPVVVPEGTYFTLGDNRENSFDSRYLGFISWRAPGRGRFSGVEDFYTFAGEIVELINLYLIWQTFLINY